MKSLKRVLVTIIAVTFVLSMAMSTVKAIPVTDLKSLKVYSVDTAGKKKQIKFKFNPTTYKYDLVVKSNVPRIEVIPTTNDATSTAVVDKEALNTRMDTGMNTTTVTVTSTGGAKQVYTLKTKKLTPAEDATYKDDSGKKSKKIKTSKKSAKIDINGKEYKITSFSKKDIPRGFVKTTAKYDGKNYDAIKGKEKDLTAFYLTGDKEGFYIYDKDAKKFYPMNNVRVKSRMYTIVEPEKEDDILKNYDKKKITIDGKKVDAWILDDEKGMFFVYAMNWDGDTSLYTYDDQEKCMQRYLIDNDVNAQIDAANQAYDNMKAKRNALVKKYNIFRYIIIGMAVIIIILLFILIHRRLNRKEKKIKDEEFVTAGMGEGKPDAKADKKEEAKEEAKADEDDIDAVPVAEDVSDEDDIDAAPVTEDDVEEVEDTDEDDIDAVPETPADERIIEDEADEEDEILDLDLDDFDDDDIVPEEIEEVQQPEVTAEEPEIIEPVASIETTPVEEPAAEPVEEPKEEPVEETHKKKRDFGKMHDGYGDEPTFGTDKESTEGFYGGEINSESDVLVDITEDDGPELADPIENMADQREIVDTSEIDVDSLSEPDDLKSTLKSMLQSDDDEESDDEDFEFIDLD